MNNMAKTIKKMYHPGDFVPEDGTYAVQTKFGSLTNTRTELMHGEKFPPIANSGYAWVLEEIL
jgi:hypothetical protein